MSCYTRHLGDWLPPEPTWDDRRALDAAVRSELGLTDADCPEVWSAVKEMHAQGRRPAVVSPRSPSREGGDR